MSNIVQGFWQRVVRCFLAGVFAVLPLVITVAVVAWVAGFINQFIGPETALGKQLGALGLRVAKDTPGVVAYAVGWIVVLGVVFLFGVLVEFGAKNLLQKIVDGLLNRVPLLGSVYKTSKQVVQMLDQKDDDALKGMTPVYCFFGTEHGAAVLALLVSPEVFRVADRDYQIVVIPTAPVPFGGGLFFVPVNCVRPAEMSVDGLMSVYISMGATAPEYIATSNAPGGQTAKDSQ